eukprot:5960360-Amphidinium_carterae.1
MTSMDRQSPQMEAAFRLLQRTWVIQLPVSPEKEGPAEGEEDQYCQVIVVALRWGSARFGTAPSQAMIVVPLLAASEYHEAIEAPVYAPGEESPTGMCQVAYVMVPGAIVWERRSESVPVDATCVFFSEPPHDALPLSVQWASLCDFPEDFASGLVVRLVGEEGEDVLLSVHRNGVQADGSGEETFYSSAELPGLRPKECDEAAGGGIEACQGGQHCIGAACATECRSKAKGCPKERKGAAAAAAVAAPPPGKLDKDALAM